MSDVVLGRAALPGQLDAGGRPAVASLDPRRALQLGLAAVWLLDGVLQFQPFMYTKAFPQMLAASAAGNPSVLARPIIWDANLIQHHLVPLNTVFATVQLLLGLGIALRPTVRPALAASVAWSVAVWWLGEGFDGALSGTANPVEGAPGAVILYALLAVLLWPADRSAAPSPYVAARAVGVRVAQVLWVALWLSLAFFAVTPANRAPGALSDVLTDAAAGEPGWLAGLDKSAASFVAGQGLAAAVSLAVACVVIALGVFMPRQAGRAVLGLAIVLSALIWVVGQALGMILATGATDPNSGPLLILLALAYWPASTGGTELAR
ncbi:MAG TPA: hypothetical protein VN714_03650 [Trebonia sp.]|jgi:hypothetical protein|nr:hypothetical protein [Trebonia sp.]